MTRRRLAILASTLPLALAGVTIFLLARPDDPLRAPARQDWKNRAVADIERQVSDRPAVLAAAGRLRPAAAEIVEARLLVEAMLAEHVLIHRLVADLEAAGRAHGGPGDHARPPRVRLRVRRRP